MNVGKICILFIRSKHIGSPRRINIPFAQLNSHVFVMQKSLLSFFKPLTEKSNNQESSPRKNEEKEQTPLKSSPKNEEKEQTPLKSSPKNEEKKLKPLKLSPQKKEKGPQSSKLVPKKAKKESKSKPTPKKEKKESKSKLTPRKEEKESKSSVQFTENKNEEQVKSSTSSPESKRKREKSPEQSPEKQITEEETSPIVEKKRKRIRAIESDSDEEVSQDTPSLKKKKEASEESEPVKREFKIFEKKKKTVEEEEELDAAEKQEGTALENESENSEKDDTIVNQEKLNESSECEKREKNDTVEKKKGAAPQKKVTTKKSSTAKRKTKKEVKSKPFAKKDDSDIVWKIGEKTPYLSLAKTLQKVEETSARLKIIDILAEYFRKVILTNKADLLPSLYLCSNTLGPAYEGMELGIADTYLMKAVAQCTGRSLAQIKADAAKIGDLGIVAEQSRSNQKLMFRPAALTVQGVFQQLIDIAKTTGQNSVKRKIDKIQALFVSCQESEARFLIRTLAGKLRIGLAEQSILQALALACTTTPPNQSDPPEVEDATEKMSPAEFKKRAEEELLILKTTYCECPNYNLIVPALFEHGVRELPKYCKITPGLPVKPMLAHPTKGVHEVFQRFDDIKFTCEWKYDGERAQIHILEDGSIRIYSRNQEDNTSKYPDIINDIRQSFKSEVKSCIIDAESVAWDREQKKIMPFQVLSTRKRKDADASEIKVRVCVFLFDLLYLNGESLTQRPLIERRNLLKEHFQEVEEKFSFVTSMDTNTMEEVQEFLDESVKGNCEGLMVKTLETEATYEIAKRSRNWLKLKKDYLDGCGDTLDLVVIGGYIGKGKRTGQYGGFLLASYDADNEEYQTICKIGTGFSEEALATHSEFLRQHVIEKAKPYYRYDESHEPDQWFDAVQVWEIKCADLSLSPIYHSGIGLVDPDKGISLRFPRFLRIREDKSVEQATSSQQVADLYKNQDQIKNNASANESKFNEEDF